MKKPTVYRSELVYNMCMALRHDYGAPTKDGERGSGMTEEEKRSLWREMEHLFDHCVEPVLVEQGIEVLM